MDNAYRMFLLAVKHMNFTKAADEIFVTQQCLSNHIKRLERELGTELFERSPRLRLTAAGESLLNMVRQIEALEKGLHEELRDLEEETVGEIRFGINVARARIFLPSLFEQFSARYPKVRVKTVTADTVDLAEMLRKGRLSVFLGVDCEPQKLFHMENISRESVYLIATSTLLRRHYAGSSPWRPLRTGDTVDLHDFPLLPLTGNLNVSTTYQLLKEYLTAQNIIPQQTFFIGDYDTQLSLCGRSLSAMTCPTLILDLLIDYNRFKERAHADPLLILRIKDLTQTLKIDLVRLKSAYQPRYQTFFEELVRQQILNYYEKIARYMSEAQAAEKAP